MYQLNTIAVLWYTISCREGGREDQTSPDDRTFFHSRFLLSLAAHSTSCLAALYLVDRSNNMVPGLVAHFCLTFVRMLRHHMLKTQTPHRLKCFICIQLVVHI